MTVYRNPTAAQDERVLNQPNKPKPKKKRKPVQAPTAAQDERVLAKPAPVTPGPAPANPEPPEPYLQNYGFSGSMRQFVARLHEATDTYTRAMGYKPSPALAFDLARWGGQYGALFGAPPKEPAEEPHPLRKVFQPAGIQGPKVPLESRYPTVQAGMLPIGASDAVEKYFELAVELGGKGKLPVREQGQSLQDYAKMLELAGVERGGRRASYDKTTGVSDPNVEEGAKLMALSKAIKTLPEAQRQLNEEMGTKLPVTGVFNRDWLKAISNWMQSEDYFRTVVNKQAHDAGYGNPQEYVNAWKNKTKAVRASGWTQHLFAALPVQMYDHGFDPLGMLQATGEYVTSDLQTINPLSKGFYDPTTHLHELTRSVGVTFGVVGGGLVQTKADLAATGAFLDTMAPKGALSWRNKNYEEAKAEMRRVLQENPTWLRVFYPKLDKKYDKEGIVELTNILGDLILLRKPSFTGETLGAGDVLAARRSTYLSSSSHWSYQELKRGQIGRAVARLDGGAGSEQLAARAAPLIRAGKMTPEQYKAHLAELYAFGETEIQVGSKVHRVQGATLAPLRARTLPTPGKAGKGWLKVKDAMRTAADEVDVALKTSKVPYTDGASKLVAKVRAETQHYVQGGPHYIYDPRMPERVHDWVLRETNDAKLATQYENRFVSMRAKENFPGLQKLQEELTEKYNMKFPLRKTGRADEFDPKLGTEAPTTFSFPRGGEREVTGPLSAIQESTRKVNKLLISGAKAHALFILGTPFTGFSLFYKHAVADTLRRAVAEEGFIAGKTQAMKAGRAEMNALADKDPRYSRLLGSAKKRSVESEQRWLLNKGAKGDVVDFQTGKMPRNRVEAAGGYLRRRLDDDALAAYRQSAATGSDKPLVDLVLNNKTYRGLWKSRRKNEPTLSAEEFADEIFGDFRQVENGLHAAGLTYDNALAVLRKNRGVKADRKLGEFIKKNGVDFEVRNGQVARTNTLDSAASWWIGKLMTFNKWNRAQLFDRTLDKTYSQLRASGMAEGPALEVSVDIAERLVTHHMLDFANRLQIEQDLRWVAYFATKHRLYWKWVMGTLLRKPGVVLVAKDVQSAMGNDGDVNFSAFGHDWKFPLTRLMWIPGKEYSEQSPMVLALKGMLTGGPGAVWTQASGNFGNVVTRNDTTLHLGAKIIKISTGKAPATYGYATAGLDERSKAFLNYRINSFQNEYFDQHGHFASEEEAVKWALTHSLANEAWRANLPFPVLPDYGENEGQKLLRQFQALRDPAKRRKFLDEHAQLSLYFGIYRDPKQYTHVRPLWEAYTQAIDKRDATRMEIFRDALHTGFTPEMQLKRRQADKEFAKTFKALLKADLNGTPEDARKELNGQTYGWWGQQVADDPLADPRKTLKLLFPNLKNVSGVPGDTVKRLRQELTLLNDPQYVKDTFEDPAEAKARKGEILRQIDVFNSYPKDALGRLERDYQTKYVGKYWDDYIKKSTAIGLLPKNQKEVAYADLREWKDDQDEPVVINGVKFPSPLRMAWATMDPVTRKQRLAQIASAGWDHLADYEKELLTGKKKNLSDKWAWYEKTIADYRHQYNLQGKNLPTAYKEQLAKWVDKQPGGGGFYKDWLYAQKPPALRLGLYAPIQESKHHDEWVVLLQIARPYATAPKTTQNRAMWRDYVNKTLKPALARPENKAFREEVELYGPDFLYSMIGS